MGLGSEEVEAPPGIAPWDDDPDEWHEDEEEVIFEDEVGRSSAAVLRWKCFCFCKSAFSVADTQTGPARPSIRHQVQTLRLGLSYLAAAGHLLAMRCWVAHQPSSCCRPGLGTGVASSNSQTQSNISLVRRMMTRWTKASRRKTSMTMPRRKLLKQ